MPKRGDKGVVLLINYIKSFTLFLFVFVSFNDAFAIEHAGGMIIKVAFGVFVLTHAKELYEMLLKPKNFVVKSFYIFILTISVVTMITYLVKGESSMYMTDILQVSFMRILSFVVIFVYVTYTKEFDKLLYMIWISLIVSSIIAAGNDPYEQWTFRRVGGTDNPNDFAAQILPTMFITYYLFKKNKSFIFLIGSILFFLYTLAYAGSKSSFIVLAFVMLFVFIVKIKDILNFIATPKGFASMFLVLAIFAGGAYYMSNSSAVKGLEQRSKKTGTLQQRLIIWRAGSEMIRDNFFLGVGFAQFPKVSGNYIKDFLPPEALPSHNNFIKVFAESGVFSFVTFFIFIASLFLSRVKEIYNSDYFWIYVGSMSVVLMSLTIPSLHHKDYWWTLVLISHGIYYFYKKEKENQKVPI